MLKANNFVNELGSEPKIGTFFLGIEHYVNVTECVCKKYNWILKISCVGGKILVFEGQESNSISLEENGLCWG